MKPARPDDLEVVGTYRLPHEALVARSVLEAFGVPAWILDETQGLFRGYHADAPRELELAVRTADAETARELLAGDHSADLEAVPESHLPPSPDELCRRCGAELAGIPRWRLRLWRPVRRCSACGHVGR